MSSGLSAEALEQLKYPVGKLQWEKEYTREVIKKLINKIEKQACNLKAALETITPGELKYSYRPGGWNIRQIVHHVADSSLNAYIRTKFALTEDTPTIKPYDENKWAELADTADTDISVSVNLFEAVQIRWVVLFRSLKHDDFNRDFFHPEMNRKVALTHLLSIYAWHADHHAAQIRVAREKKF
jgi:hypothetical protein